MLRIFTQKEIEDQKLKNKLLHRESSDDPEAIALVRTIIDNVLLQGKDAVVAYAKKFDRREPSLIEKKDFAFDETEEDVREAFTKAHKNILAFHEFQCRQLEAKETEIDGTKLGYYYRPVDSAAVYVPGGKALYPSSVLMGVTAARAAGVKRVIIVSPPSDREEKYAIDPVIQFCAHIAGADAILACGGAHAVTAAAAGIYTSPVDIIVGPGNRYVTAAKTLLSATGRIKIDQPAGPSEVIVIADESANPAFVAADMLSQAEHGEDSPAILLTTSRELAEKTANEIEKGLTERPDRRVMKETSIEKHSYAVVFDSLNAAVQYSNDYAPEHLELCVQNPDDLLDQINAAGSVFVGHYAPVALGDYYSGTNHVLPTGGTAKMYSGLGVETFMKRITYQKPTRESLMRAREPIDIMSRVEGLEHEHGHSVHIRFSDS